MGGLSKYRPLNETQEELKSLLDYNEITGELRWKVSFQRVQAGEVAGGIQRENGYLSVRINKVSYLAHRVVWKWWYGDDPADNCIDHINTNKQDNRIENLRILSRSLNNLNSNGHSDATSGVVGVSLDSKTNLWEASIKIHDKKRFIGYFEDFIEAVYHRYAAEQCLFDYGMFNSSAKYYIMSGAENKRVTGRTRRKNSNNTSGITGVIFNGKSWIAQIKVSRKNIMLYCGACKEEAAAHRRAAEECLATSKTCSARYASRT